MHRWTVLLVIVGWTANAVAASVGVIRDCRTMASRSTSYEPYAASFDITARITAISDLGENDECRVNLEDTTGGYPLPLKEELLDSSFAPGDTVRVEGKLTTRPGLISTVVAKISRLGSERPYWPPHVPSGEIKNRLWDNRVVSVEGSVMDVFRDETDPNFIYLILRADGENLAVSYRDDARPQMDYTTLRGSEVAVRGIVSVLNAPFSLRRLGAVLSLYDFEDLNVMCAADDLGGIPDVAGLDISRPAKIARCGRYKLTGRVLAAWQGSSFLVRRADGACSTVRLASGAAPKVGDTVVADGYPSTDLYHVNLTHARWHPAHSSVTNETAVLACSARTLARDARRRARFDMSFHGKTLRLRGTVGSAHGLGGRENVLALEEDETPFDVDLSACPDVLTAAEPGARLEVTGVCLMEISNWSQNEIVPQIRGITIVPRTATDVRILARPPWWTPSRLAMALVALVAILLASFVVIGLLRRILARRSRELEAEIGARIESECLIEERTRLAVELHDSIAQNLTGATLELQMAARTAQGRPEDLSAHLGIALKTVQSSLADLRNCIWDLRSHTLEETDFAEAIRQTLRPRIGAATLSVRFNVPRRILSDNAAHAILSIVRELAINAVRHGRATSVKVAGTIEGGRLRFSVRDDGCGFDVQTRPGIREGHFGLQGIAERLRPFNGTMKVESAPGKGTRVSVAINLPRELLA